jgi:hypothetical protein
MLPALCGLPAAAILGRVRKSSASTSLRWRRLLPSGIEEIEADHPRLAHRVSQIRSVPTWRKPLCVDHLHEQPNCWRSDGRNVATGHVHRERTVVRFFVAKQIDEHLPTSQLAQKGDRRRKSTNVPPSLWFAALAKPERVQTNQLAHESDGRVCTISYKTRLRRVKLRRRHVAQKLS